MRGKYGASSLRDSSLWIKYHSDEYIKGEFLMNPKMEMTCINQLLPYICKVKKAKKNDVASNIALTADDITVSVFNFSVT